MSVLVFDLQALSVLATYLHTVGTGVGHHHSMHCQLLFTAHLTNLRFLLVLLLLLQSHARERKDIMAVSTLDELRDWLDEQSVRFLSIIHTLVICHWILSRHV
jgi:hypothetical protein